MKFTDAEDYKIVEIIKRIQASDRRWYLIADEKLADAVFAHIRDEYPGAQIIKIAPPYCLQYIVATDEAKKELVKSLQEMYLDYDKRACCIKKAVQCLSGGTDRSSH